MSTSDAGWAARSARRIAAAGQTVTLARASEAVEVAAFVRGFDPEALASGSGLQQGDRRVVIAAAALAASGWTGGAPRRHDRVTIGSATTVVQSAETRTVGAEAVRYDLTVRGG